MRVKSARDRKPRDERASRARVSRACDARVAWCATRRVSRPRLTFNTFPVKRRARGFFLARKATSVVHFRDRPKTPYKRPWGFPKCTPWHISIGDFPTFARSVSRSWKKRKGRNAFFLFASDPRDSKTLVSKRPTKTSYEVSSDSFLDRSSLPTLDAPAKSGPHSSKKHTLKEASFSLFPPPRKRRRESVRVGRPDEGVVPKVALSLKRLRRRA